MNKQVCPTTMTSLGDRKMAFTISTAAVDRDGDTIDPRGWQLDNYRRSPVVLWAHDHTQPPIGKASNLWSDAKGLHATVEFPPTGIYPFADQVHDLVKTGFLSATSVGFIPKESRPSKTGQAITQAELLEFSIVSVPSNPQALLMHRSIDTTAVKKWLNQSDDTLLDWDAINAGPEVDVTASEVLQALHALTPALREGVRAGIKMQAQLAAHAAICRLTGRLD